MRLFDFFFKKNDHGFFSYTKHCLSAKKLAVDDDIYLGWVLSQIWLFRMKKLIFLY